LDMSGNVWEFCLNEYDKPQNVTFSGQSRRVGRGGSWASGRSHARAAYRDDGAPDFRLDYVGFRLARASPI